MKVTFHPHDQSPVSYTASDLEEQGLNRIIIYVSPAQLREAEVNGWFFMKPELKGKMTDGSFLLSLPLKIELAIRPDLTYRFQGLKNEWGGNIEMLNALAWEASQPGATEPDVILRPDSWLCLRVEQEQPSGITAYDTLWMKIIDKMEQMEIGPKDLDFQQIEIYFDEGAEDANLSNLDIEFGDGGKIFTKWQVPDNPRYTPSTPIEDTDPRSIPQFNLLAALGNFLDGKNIRYRLKENNCLQFAHQGKGGRWGCEAIVDEGKKLLTFYSLHPFTVDIRKNEEIENWLNSLNNKIDIGSFLLDREKGDFKYRTSGQFTSTGSLENHIYNLWKMNVETFDRHYKEISSKLT